MEESEKELTVSADETIEAAEPIVEPVEVEIEETLTRTKVISRLKAIVCELEGGSLVVGGAPVSELGDSVDFEFEYSEKKGKHKIEIELKW